MIFGVTWGVLTALSRMYLGRHFLADVLGGAIIGILAIVITYFLTKPIDQDKSNDSPKALIGLGLVTVILMILTPLVDLLHKESIGRLLGVLATFFILYQLGFPQDKAPIWKRIGRILVTVVIYGIIDKLINPADLLGISKDSFGVVILIGTVSFLAFAGSILLSKRLNLYERIDR